MHAFFHCPFAKDVWRHLPLHQSVHIADGLGFKDSIILFRKAICLPPTGVRTPIFPWVCWFIWTTRNQLIFEGRTSNPTEVVSKALAAALEWDQAQKPKESTKRRTVLPDTSRRHALHSASNPACFVDAAWNASSRRAGIAWSISAEVSNRTLSGSRVIDNVSSPLTAEALALRHGLRQALDLGFSSITLNSDCATLIRAITTKIQIKELYGILQDINCLSSRFASLSFQLIPRSQNREADILAKRALKAHLFSSASVISLG